MISSVVGSEGSVMRSSEGGFFRSAGSGAPNSPVRATMRSLAPAASSSSTAAVPIVRTRWGAESIVTSRPQSATVSG